MLANLLERLLTEICMAVIRLKSWPFSAMISANNWLERGSETILDESFCLIMRPCHCSSSVLALFADDAIRQFCLICWFLRNLADANYGMLRGCAIFQHPRFLQTICLWSLPVLVLVLSVLTLFALMEHTKLEQIKLGLTIHASFNELEPIDMPFDRTSTPRQC